MTQPGTKPESSNPQPERILSPGGEVLALRFNVLGLLEAEVGADWQHQISEVIEAGKLNLRAPDGHYTNREAGTTARLGLVTAEGANLALAVPGVWTLYQGPFKGLMQQALPEGAEPLKAYDDPKLALEGYAQRPVAEARGSDVQHRMEAHVDMRYTAVLVVDVPEGDLDGGRLVIGNNPDAQSVDEINSDATHIKHRPGTLVCFSHGRTYPHYTEEITNPQTKRIVISMNYPLETESEEAAQDLLKHIQGVDH